MKTPAIFKLKKEKRGVVVVRGEAAAEGMTKPLLCTIWPADGSLCPCPCNCTQLPEFWCKLKSDQESLPTVPGVTGS